MDLRSLRNNVIRTQAAGNAIRTRGRAGLPEATRELVSIEERIRASEAIGDYRQGVPSPFHAPSPTTLSPPAYERRGLQQQAAEMQIPQPPPPPQSPSRKPKPCGLAFVEPLIFASSAWKTASIYRDEGTDRLQTHKSHISPTCTRTKQLKIMRITEDVTSYDKLKERALQVVCINLPRIGHAVAWEEDAREVAVQDVQVIWTGSEAQSEDADDGSWFTSLKGLADEEVSLCLEKMEEREWKDRLAVVFRLSEDN